jgi:hypothetical protein
MPDEMNPSPPSNGAAQQPEPRKSLREVAEDAYDQVLDASEADDSSPDVDDSGQPRDAQGRFLSRPQPGEAAEAQKPPPSPDSGQPQPQDAHPAPQGSSSEPPANWSAEVRARFQKLTPEDQQFLLQRHHEMESDYQRKVQATAQADSFVRSLAPVFSDPVIAGSLQQAQWAPSDAIREWAGFHKWFITDPQGLIGELQRRAGIDPAAMAPSRSGGPGQLSEADLKDPAIQYFADHVGQTSKRVQQLEGRIQQMQQQAAQAAEQEALKVTRWGIDSFAEEKDQQGNLLRPDFDALMPQIIELYQANPGRDLNEAYQTARWMNPDVRKQLIAAERSTVERQQADQRARVAVRANTRGVTSPVSKPGEPQQGGKNLREILESTADEIGF